jgi:hypothetical protein
MPGVAEFAEELECLGYEVEVVDGFVIFDYMIDIGPLDGLEIRVGLDGRGHPHSPPSGPFVSPWLLPLRPDASPAPRGGVHDARGREFPVTAGEWQYWSRPFQEWAQHGRTVQSYLDVHLRRLFAQLPGDLEVPCAA